MLPRERAGLGRAPRCVAAPAPAFGSLRPARPPPPACARQHPPRVNVELSGRTAPAGPSRHEMTLLGQAKAVAGGVRDDITRADPASHDIVDDGILQMAFHGIPHGSRPQSTMIAFPDEKF
jgi:hypothetical protein